MERKSLTIRELAARLGTTYEHVRGIVRGERIPSNTALTQLAKELDLDQKESRRLATADRIRIKYGSIPLELSGKNPELEPIERAWAKLSDEHKQDLIALAKTYARRDGTGV